jgi:hypothetical protein
VGRAVGTVPLTSGFNVEEPAPKGRLSKETPSLETLLDSTVPCSQGRGSSRGELAPRWVNSLVRRHSSLLDSVGQGFQIAHRHAGVSAGQYLDLENDTRPMALKICGREPLERLDPADILG